MGEFQYRKAGLIALALVLLKVLVLFATLTLVKRQGVEPVLCSWDCGYYVEIAEKGYSWKENQHGPLAFFPLYPLVAGTIRDFIFPSFSFAAVGIGLNLFLFGTFCMLFMYWSWLVGLSMFWMPAVILAFDRFSLWATVPYTEPLFLNFMMLFFLTLRRFPENSKRALLLSSLIGGFASASRIVGVAFVAALGLSKFNYFIRRPFFGLLCLLLGLAGVAAFFTYVHFALGSWDMSLKTTAAWNRKFSLLGFFNSAYYLLKQFYFPTILSWALTLWAIFKCPKEIKFNLTEKFLMAWLIFIPMANTIPVGLSRYFSILLFGPVMISLGLSRFNKWPYKVLFGLFLASELYWQVILLGKFFRFEVFSWAA